MADDNATTSAGHGAPVGTCEVRGREALSREPERERLANQRLNPALRAPPTARNPEPARAHSACTARPKFVTSRPQDPCPSASHSHAYKVALNTTPKSAKPEPSRRPALLAQDGRMLCGAGHDRDADHEERPDDRDDLAPGHAARNPVARDSRRRRPEQLGALRRRRAHPHRGRPMRTRQP